MFVLARAKQDPINGGEHNTSCPNPAFVGLSMLRPSNMGTDAGVMLLAGSQHPVSLLAKSCVGKTVVGKGGGPCGMHCGIFLGPSWGWCLVLVGDMVTSGCGALH